MSEITIPPEAVEAAAFHLPGYHSRGLWPHVEAAIRAALTAWKPSWTETECDNAGVIVSRVYVLDITPEESAYD